MSEEKLTKSTQDETAHSGCPAVAGSPSSIREGKVFFAYRGPLFGKRGRKYIPLKMASDDVDGMEKERDAMLDLIKHMDIHSNYTRCGYAKMDAAQRELFDRISSGPFSWENDESIHPESKPASVKSPREEVVDAPICSGHLGGFNLLRGKLQDGQCAECAVVHEPEMPHNQESMFWQYGFMEKHGRWPTWEDALAHCTPEMREQWVTALAEHGVIVPNADVDAQADTATPIQNQTL